MKTKIFLALALFLLISGVQAGTVTRSLSATSVAPGSDVTVTLTVDIINETYYAIDETIPTGWTIKSAGTGSTNQPMHLKWVVFENPADITFTYIVTAPATAGTATFSGKYMFEGAIAESNIGGATTVTIIGGAGTLSVSPSSGLSSSGLAGGPFSPSSVSYTLSNPGQTSINYAVSKTQSWVSLTNASGSLAAGASISVVVSINSGANSLAVGAYSDTISFTNSTNGDGNASRSVSLTVSAPTCSQGQITTTCICAGVERTSGSGYCCSGQFQTTACAPPVQCTSDSNCSSGQICCGNSCSTPACSSQITCPTNYQCQSSGTCSASCIYSPPPPPPPPGGGLCISDSNCSIGTLCCSGSCKTPACGATKSCLTKYACQNPDACNAACSLIQLKKFSIQAPDYFIVSQEFILTAKDTSGNPVEGATASYAGEQKTTAADGSVSFTAKKNQYLVTFKKDGFQNATITRPVKASGTTGTISSSKKITLTVSDIIFDGEPFIVTVIDSNNVPVEGAEITYGTQKVQTDASGEAELIGKTGVYIITAKAGTITDSTKVLPKKPATSPDQNVPCTGPNCTAPTVLTIDWATIILIVLIIVGGIIILRMGRKK